MDMRRRTGEVETGVHNIVNQLRERLGAWFSNQDATVAQYDVARLWGRTLEI